MMVLLQRIRNNNRFTYLTRNYDYDKIKVRREKKEKMANSENSALICNLKGRIAKVLNTGAASLPLDERSGLDGIYDAIDNFLLSKREDSDVAHFKEELRLHARFLNDTKRTYIKEHIVPLVKKVSTGDWGSLDE